MTDLHHLERQLSRLRDQLAVLGTANPTPAELADQDAADHAMAQRIRSARPGLPLHHVYITLQALRAVQELDRPGCPDTIVVDNPRNTGWYWTCTTCDASAGKYSTDDQARAQAAIDHPQCPPDPNGPYAWTIPTATEATEPTEERNLVHALGGDRTAKTIAHTLTVHGHTLNAVRTMTYAELLAVPGIGGPSLARIRAALDGWPEQDGTNEAEIGDIQITRKLGHGLIVDNAPPHTRMALAVLANTGWGARVQGADCINIGDQVLYRVTGYDPEQAALLLDLVEDWRPVPTVKLRPADEEQPGA